MESIDIKIVLNNVFTLIFTTFLITGILKNICIIYRLSKEKKYSCNKHKLEE